MRAKRLSATVGEALSDAVDRLRAAGTPTPRIDGEVLLGHVLGRDRSWLLAHPEARLTPDDEAALRALVERRSSGEPVAYIRGFKEWFSLRIRTDARALIPRPETEVLAEGSIAEIAARLAGEGQVTAWEVATGSGAVAVAIAHELGGAIAAGRLTLIASDASPDALGLAAENLQAHDVARLVTLVEADLMQPAAGGRPLPLPDVVVANLPYLSTAEVDAAPGSLAFEPRIALEGGPDGLDLLRRFFVELPRTAAPGATVLLEVALGQADAVLALAPPTATTETLPDLSGEPRVVVARLSR